MVWRPGASGCPATVQRIYQDRGLTCHVARALPRCRACLGSWRKPARACQPVQLLAVFSCASIVLYVHSFWFRGPSRTDAKRLPRASSGINGTQDKDSLRCRVGLARLVASQVLILAAAWREFVNMLLPLPTWTLPMTNAFAPVSGGVYMTHVLRSAVSCMLTWWLVVFRFVRQV